MTEAEELELLQLRKTKSESTFIDQVSPQKKERSFLDLPEAITNPTPENIAADPLIRLITGVGKGAVGTTQFLNRYALGAPIKGVTKGIDWVAQQIDETEKLAKKGLKERGEEYNILGTVGEVLNPFALKVTKAFPLAKTFKSRMLQSSELGALYSVMQPYVGEDGGFDIDKLGKAISGAATGAVIQGLVVEPIRYAGKLIHQFFTESGAKEVSKQYLETILGGKENLDKLVSTVEKYLTTSKPSSVPGYKPTAGELVADVPEAGPFLALQYKTSQTAGGPSGLFRTQEVKNEDAIKRAIGSFAGTQETLSSALGRANTRAEMNYGPLMGRTVSPESDVSILMRDMQRARGVPWYGAPSDIVRATPNPRTGMPFGEGQQSLLGTVTGKAGALQQAGKAQADVAQQTSFANKWLPVPGMPRVAGRYSPNIEVAEQAKEAARLSLEKAGIVGKEADFLQAMIDRADRFGLGTKQGLTDIQVRPSIAHAFAYAQKRAREKGYSFPSSMSHDFTVRNLHDIKMGLDDAIRLGSMRDPVTGSSAADNATLEAMAGTKTTFLDWLKTKVPEYEKARAAYAEDMVPVNQMRVGQELLGKLTSPTGMETPGAFLRSIDDAKRLIKTATGQSRQDLGDVLLPQNTKIVSDVGEILERKVASLSPQRKASLPGGTDIAAQVGFELPSMLSTPIVVTNWLLKTLRKGSSPLEQRVDAINSFWMLNPDKFVEAIRMMNKQDRSALLQAMKKGGVDPVAQGIIGPASLATTED